MNGTSYFPQPACNRDELRNVPVVRAQFPCEQNCFHGYSFLTMNDRLQILAIMRVRVTATLQRVVDEITSVAVLPPATPPPPAMLAD